MSATGTRTVTRACSPIVATLLLLPSGRGAALAGSATWNLNPATNVWNTNSNWTPATGFPNGPADTATFGVSNTTAVSTAASSTQVAQILYTPGASAYTITLPPLNTLTLSGTGVTNNSGITQSFVAQSSGAQSGFITFANGATAGSNTSFTSNSGTTSGTSGSTRFLNTSTAGSAAFTNLGATVTGPSGGRTLFFDTATAAGATFTNHGGAASGGGGGFTQFFGTSTAGIATFINTGVMINAGGGGGLTVFSDSATAANGTFNNHGATALGAAGGTRFNNASTAATATFVNHGATVVGTTGGTMQFNNTATAGSATFTNHGGTTSGGGGGSIFFGGSSTAGNATITTNAGAVAGGHGGSTQFGATATAGSATFVANGGAGIGGQIQFFDNSTGGSASFDLRNNGAGTPGSLEIGFHNAPGLTIGSLEGSGTVFLGSRNLTVGSNHLSKTFSGVIQDGGPAGGTGGSLTKTGAGTLTLTGANTYSGDTTVAGGIIVASASANLGNAGNRLVLDGGTLRTNGSIVSTRKIAVQAGGGTIDTNGFDSSFGEIDPGDFSKAGGGTLTVTRIHANALSVTAGVLKVAQNGTAAATSRLTSLAIAPAARLDLSDNDLLVDYTGTSVEGAIRQLVKNGRASGTGITSTSGSPDDDKVLAVADNTNLNRTAWLGVNIDTTTIIGKYTYFGDANLDGKVTGDDYLNVDANLGTGDSWLEGDFNMSGVTTGDDYLAIDANLGKGTADPLAFAELKEEMVALHVAMFGEEYLVKLAQAEAEGFGASVVPEPGTISLIGLAAVGLVRRRRLS